MPPKRSYNNRKKRSYKKRGYKKKKLTTHIPRQLTGIPDTTMAKFKFSYIARHTMATASHQFVFKGNDAYEPNPGATSAAGFQQWWTFYQAYLVNASKIDVKFLAGSDTVATQNLSLNLYPVAEQIGTIPSLSRLDLLGNPYNKNRLVTSSASQGALGHMSNYMTTQKIFGVSGKLDLTEYSVLIDQSTGLPLASPQLPWSWVLQADQLVGTAGSIIDLQISITYYVKFFDRLQLPQL